MNNKQLARIAFAMTVLSAFFILSYHTQARLDDFKVGDKVEATVSGLVGVENSYEPCTVIEVLGNGYNLKCGTIVFTVQKAWVRRPQNAARDEPKPVVRDRQPDADPAPTDDDEECDFTAPGPKVASTDRFSVALAKRKLYDNYQVSVRPGGVSSPLKVGVAWQSVTLLQSFTNTVDPRGFRINDAAPAGATIYRVSSKHIVCEQYRNATERRQVESNYACFKDRDGDWACGLDGIPKIVQLR
jgi:hypothetical protein